MKIFQAFNNGLRDALKSWKGVIIIWLVSFVLISFVKMPVVGSLNTLFGSSMITEQLNESIDVEVFADLGTENLFAIGASMIKSVGFAWVIAFLLNIFLTGGMFDYLSNTSREFKLKGFLKASSSYFGSFFVIKLFSSLLIVVCAFFLYLFVYLINTLDGAFVQVICGVVAAGVVFFILQILVASDYARAKKITRPDAKGSKAFGYGFKVAFSKYMLPSLSLMLLMIVIQVIILLPLSGKVLSWFPQGQGGVFMLFVCAQIMYLMNTFMKVWRFGCFTNLMQQIPVATTTNVSQPSGQTDSLSTTEVVAQEEGIKETVQEMTTQKEESVQTGIEEVPEETTDEVVLEEGATQEEVVKQESTTQEEDVKEE